MSSSDENAEIIKTDCDDKIFKKLRSNLSISQKIEFIVKRYDNAYFIDKEIDTLTHVEEIIRPLQKVKKSY